MTPEIQAKISILRAKAADNTITLDECREAVTLMRADRKAAHTTSAKARTKQPKAAVQSADEMLDELGK